MPTSYHKVSPIQLVYGQKPNISHLRTFMCAIYVPISPPHHTKWVLMGIYVGYESSSISKLYPELSTGDLFTSRFEYCHFDESKFPTLGGEIKKLENKLSWNELSLSSFRSSFNSM